MNAGLKTYIMKISFTQFSIKTLHARYRLDFAHVMYDIELDLSVN